jgi:adenosyl cobinamide kinase/adenosyl cobinamide phosphate guanylyltransferase
VIVLVLGGTRSGKSQIAERIASTLPQPVTYVATAHTSDDADFVERIARHRARRPKSWRTVEEHEQLAARVAELDGTVLVDSLGAWIAGGPDFTRDVGALYRTCCDRIGDTVLVGEEVGLAVHAPTEAGRRFTDAMGDCNRRLAEIADRVLLVVAGRTLELGALDA